MKKYLVHPLLLSMFIFAIGCENNPDSTDRAEDTNEERFEENKAMENDAEFAVEAANIGMYQVRAGELAQSKATNARVKEMGAMMVQDHTKANNELKDLAARKNIQIPTAMGDDKMDAYDELAEKSGDDFDEAFVDKMIDAHEKALKEFRDEADGGADTEMKSWASQQIPALEQHLNQFKRLKDGDYTGDANGVNNAVN